MTDKVNHLFDKFAVKSPEHIGISNRPQSILGCTVPELGDLLYVDAEYMKSKIGISSANIYQGTIPVMVVEEDAVIVLGDNAGVVVWLPVSVNRLAKHAKFWNAANADNFHI